MKDEGVTPEDFDRLLLWLDSDREQAALKYEKIRVRMTKFFVCRGCGCDADSLSDETFNRIMRKLKLGQVLEPQAEDKVSLFLGFAKNICHEYLRKPAPTQEVVKPIVDHPDGDNDVEAESQCLDKCMRYLAENKRSLVIEYYLFEKSDKIKHRKEMATELGIDVKALRLQIYRIREHLKPCIENCLTGLRVS